MQNTISANEMEGKQNTEFNETIEKVESNEETIDQTKDNKEQRRKC